MVCGVPIHVEAVDAREAALRAGPHAAALPRAGTSEGRQLRRWLTQLLVTEQIIAAEAAASGLTTQDAPPEREVLPDNTARVELGSITAAALAQPLGRALYAHVTSDVNVTDDVVSAYQARNPHRFANATDVAEHLRAAARRRAFGIWLDVRRATLVELSAGYEHPGDPRQPDNTHRH
ncbi:MAG TPA: malonyl CoA-ACP transacylase [Mycobacterium sp.]